MDSKNKKNLNIDLPEDLAEGVYVNLAMISHSPEEFVMDFIRVAPGVPKAKVKSRVVMTPQHAKRFLGALIENVERFEKAHGHIAMSRAGGPDPMAFQVPGGEA